MKRAIKLTIGLIIVIVLILLLIRVHRNRVSQLNALKTIAVRVTPVNVVSVREGEVSTTISEQGIVMAQTESAIAPQVMGRCLFVSKREGDYIHTGEIIARVDDQELQDAYAAQNAEIASGNETAAAQLSAVQSAKEEMAAKVADMNSAQALIASQLSDVEGAKQNVASQQSQVAAVEATMAGAISAASTQQSRTARDKILYENQAISLEQWQSSQTASVQANAAVAALKQQIAALRSGVNAAKQKVIALEHGVDSTRQKVISMSKLVNDAQQRVFAQWKIAAAAKRKVSVLTNTAHMGKTRIGYTVIRAPYDAVVSARLAEPGDLLLPGQPIYKVIKPGSVKVEVNIPQESMPQVHIGTIATLAANGRGMLARVSRVFPAMSTGGLGIVEFDLPRPPFGLASGSTLDVTLQVRSRNGKIVPEPSILNTDRGNFLYIVRNNILQCVPIRVEVSGASDAIVTGSVQVGDNVVVARQSELMVLHEGEPVSPNPGDGGVQ